MGAPGRANAHSIFTSPLMLRTRIWESRNRRRTLPKRSFRIKNLKLSYKIT